MGRTPLYLAAEVGFTDGVNMLIRAEVSDAWNHSNINHPRWRVLREAVDSGHRKLGDLRIDEGISSSTGNRGRRWGTALVAAARGGHLDTITLIIKLGSRMHANSTLQYSPEAIFLAAAGGHLAVVQLLVEQGVDLEGSGSLLFQSPLYHAAKGGNLHIVELLIARGVDVNLPGSDGSIALQGAAQKGHVEIVEELIMHRAAINARPEFITGRIALQAAAGGAHLDIVRLLIERGADVNAKSTPYG